MSDPLPYRRRTAAALAVAAATVAAYPKPHAVESAFNLALFGAVGVFAAAHAAFSIGVVLCLGAKLATDLLTQRDLYPSVYLGYIGYPVVGWLLARHSHAPWRVGLAAVLGGVPFFLVTNFASWQGRALDYNPGLDGLLDSYWKALPFHRSMFVNDVVFIPLLFAAHYAVLKLLAPVPAAVEVRS